MKQNKTKTKKMENWKTARILVFSFQNENPLAIKYIDCECSLCVSKIIQTISKLLQLA